MGQTLRSSPFFPLLSSLHPSTIVDNVPYMFSRGSRTDSSYVFHARWQCCPIYFAPSVRMQAYVGQLHNFPMLLEVYNFW